MATYTPNLNLTLPAGTENVSRQVINDNNSAIDTAVGNNKEAIANIMTPCCSVVDRWLRFDPSNKKGLIIKGNTHIKKANGEFAHYTTDTQLDFSEASLEAGKDYGVYLLNDGTISTALLSGTAPSNSVKIGRFHTLCVAVGTISDMQIAMSPSCGYSVGGSVLVKPYRESSDPDFYAFYNKTITAVTVQSHYDIVKCHHPLSGYSAGDILPESVFCLSWYPDTLFEDAMVYDKASDIVVDVYLQSGTGLNTRSAYNATHTVSREEICHAQDFKTVGKRFLTDHEFLSAAIGSNEKTAITGASDKTYVGGHVDSASRRMISAIGVEEMCGYLWQWLNEIAPVGGSDWKTYDTHASFGQSYGTIPYCMLGGGHWANSSSCGSRSRDGGDPRSSVATHFGGRGASQVCRSSR